MSSLYSDPHFEIHMEKLISKMYGPMASLSEIMDWLENRTDDKNVSLTDIWGVITTAAIMKQVPVQHPEICLFIFSSHNYRMQFTPRCFVLQLELRHLSEEAKRNATNPYPIYSAVERELTSEKPEKGTVTCTEKAFQSHLTEQGGLHV